MQEKIIIFLSAIEAEQPSWVIVDAESNGVQQAQGSGDELALAALDKEIIVMVPAEDVVLTTLTLPKMNRTRLMQALPFALEEQLIGDLDALHFTPSDYQADGSVSVAIVAKEKMQTWLSQLQSWNIQADAILPLIFAQPVEENTWHVMLDQTAVVRTNTYQGFACDINNLSDLLGIALASSQSPPQLIHIHNYTAHAMTPALTAPVPIKEDFHDAKQLPINLAVNIVKFPYINLLQGGFKTKKTKYPKMQNVWKALFGLAAAFLCLLFLYPTMSYFILKQRANDIDQRIAEIYKHNFPQSTAIVAPKLRMEEKLRTVTSQFGDNRVLGLMGMLGAAMKAVPGIHLNHVDYQNNQITLELNAASSDDLTKFTEFLTQQGLRVNQQNATLEGERMNATIVME